MLISSGEYKDTLSGLNYSISSNITSNKKNIYIIQGENGVGKSRFVEGVLLKELKKYKKKVLYFGQDIENQILSFKLISLVKTFVSSLKKEGKFFKTILLNDDSHNDINLNFDEKSVLRPDKDNIKKFIQEESSDYYPLDVVIFDEVDKYFDSENEFVGFIQTLPIKNIFIISHILDRNLLNDTLVLFLKNNNKGVCIELTNG